MENSLWKALAFILCAILLFLAPLLSMLERQDDIAYNIVFTECNRFVDSCRDTGYITPDMYSEFMHRLNSTGNTYKVTLFHIKRSVNPIYIQDGANMTFTGGYELISVSTPENEILERLFPSNTTMSALDKGRRYDMRMGDLLFVEVRNTGKTMAAALRDMLFFSETEAPSIFVRAGGMVRNEAY